MRYRLPPQANRAASIEGAIEMVGEEKWIQEDFIAALQLLLKWREHEIVRLRKIVVAVPRLLREQVFDDDAGYDAAYALLELCEKETEND